MDQPNEEFLACAEMDRHATLHLPGAGPAASLLHPFHPTRIAHRKKIQKK